MKKSGPTDPPNLINAAILQADLSSYLDTLHNLFRKDDREKGHQKLIDRIKISPAGWSNSALLMQLPYAIQWHSDLAEYGASATPLHDVYLVSVPQTHWLYSLKHWSLYSQGTFFHLVLQEDQIRLQVDAFTEEELKAEYESMVWQVRCDNVHRLNAYVAHNRQVPMIAFHVGQTQFDITQIHCLAESILGMFQEYTKQEKNCQLFVLSLAIRVLMAKGVGSIFVGTKAQIAHWDVMPRTVGQPLPYSQEEGFLLRAPSHDLSNRSADHFWNLPALCADGGYMSNAMAVRRLYLHGPYSFGSFDTYGRHTFTLPLVGIHVSAASSKRLRDSAKDIGKAMKEFSRDIANGKLADAVRGRRTSNLRSYETAVITAIKGDSIAYFLLPFHRFVLSISKEDAEEIHRRLGNAEASSEKIECQR